MTNIVATYDYYTLDQAREIIKSEERLKRQRELRRRKLALYYIKQKAIGLLFIIMSTIITMVCDAVDESGISILFFIFGIFLVFTREKIINR